MSSLIAILVLVGSAYLFARYAPADGKRGVFRAEQFRLAAPLAGIFPTEPSEPRPTNVTPVQLG
ncbi:hypothetical protein [Rhodococcus sp. NPDC058521]|uniref:hypothetical protein n=1 Tax=Rhodococcus sp. NPDC058521 TaxID=3346536 RepID=UPI00364CC033